MSERLFLQNSLYWKINREWLISFAGPRAVLLEMAHPLVAAGVAQHSNYRTDPFGRLYRTMKTMTEISFGNDETARPALASLHACHAHVSGVSADAHATYHANDPQLRLWVWATLVDSVVRVYDRFVTPLTYADKGAYYDDCVRLARLMGIPASVIPITYTEFNLYLGAMLESATLTVSCEARAVVKALFAPTVRGRATLLFSQPGIGMLPERLRDEFGFTWDRQREARIEKLAVWTRRMRPWLPRRLAIHPKAYAEERKQTDERRMTNDGQRSDQGRKTGTEYAEMDLLRGAYE